MATQYGFYFEADRCIDCRACSVACKQWNGIKAGTTNWRLVTSLWNGQYPNVTETFLSMACNHCGSPACAKVCPVGAITKRAEDGLVVVNQEKCIGCRSCLAACPFGVPQYGASGKMEKCTYCQDRLAQGKQPICAETCVAKALHAGTMDELNKLAAGKKLRTLTVDTQPSLLISQ